MFLGHDHPQENIDLEFLLQYRKKLWVHCKDVESLGVLADKNINCFGHSTDEFVLTSKGYIFTFPGTKQTENSISVMPEISNSKHSLSTFAVCTDYPYKYKK